MNQLALFRVRLAAAISSAGARSAIEGAIASWKYDGGAAVQGFCEMAKAFCPALRLGALQMRRCCSSEPPHWPYRLLRSPAAARSCLACPACLARRCLGDGDRVTVRFVDRFK
jgi:hypothetical protein